MKVTCVSKSLNGTTLRYNMECESTFQPLLRAMSRDKFFDIPLVGDTQSSETGQENVEVFLTTPTGVFRFARSGVPHDAEIEYLYPAEFTTDLTDRSGAIFDAGMQDAEVDVDGVIIPYKIWNVFSPHKPLLGFFEHFSPKTQKVQRSIVPGFQWNPRTKLIVGTEERYTTLQERMSAVMNACMAQGASCYTGEDVTASVKEGQNYLGDFIHIQKWDIQDGLMHHISWIPYFKDATVRFITPAEIVYQP